MGDEQATPEQLRADARDQAEFAEQAAATTSNAAPEAGPLFAVLAYVRALWCMALADQQETQEDALRVLTAAVPGPRRAPTRERIADAIENACDSSGITLAVMEETGESSPNPLYRLARCLDVAGLIDWSGVGPGELPPHASDQHQRPDVIPQAAHPIGDDVLLLFDPTVFGDLEAQVTAMADGVRYPTARWNATYLRDVAANLTARADLIERSRPDNRPSRVLTPEQHERLGASSADLPGLAPSEVPRWMRGPDGRRSAVHEPVTYLPSEEWTRLRGTDVEVYHRGSCPCSRTKVYIRHRSAQATRPLSGDYSGLRERLRLALGIDPGAMPDDDGLIADVEEWIRLARAFSAPVPGDGDGEQDSIEAVARMIDRVRDAGMSVSSEVLAGWVDRLRKLADSSSVEPAPAAAPDGGGIVHGTEYAGVQVGPSPSVLRGRALTLEAQAAQLREQADGIGRRRRATRA